MPDTSGFKTDQRGAYIDKDPAATLTYTIDYSQWLATDTTLNSSTYTVSTVSGDAAPLTVDATSIGSGIYANVILSGGTPGNIYTVTNTVGTTASDSDARRFKVKVENRFL
jgi:hypothetical protein